MKKITFIIILHFVAINIFAQLFNYKQVDSIKIKDMGILTTSFSRLSYPREEFDSIFVKKRRYDPILNSLQLKASVITNKDSIKFCINLLNNLEKAEDFILTKSDTVYYHIDEKEFSDSIVIYNQYCKGNNAPTLKKINGKFYLVYTWHNDQLSNTCKIEIFIKKKKYNLWVDSCFVDIFNTRYYMSLDLLHFISRN